MNILKVFQFDLFKRKAKPEDKPFVFIWYKEMLLRNGNNIIKNYTQKFKTTIHAPTEAEARKRLEKFVREQTTVHIYTETQWEQVKKKMPDIDAVFAQMNKTFDTMNDYFKKLSKQ